MEFFRHAESWVLVSFILFIALLVYLKVPALVAKILDERAAKNWTRPSGFARRPKYFLPNTRRSAAMPKPRPKTSSPPPR
jgi:hypothetical protein